MGLLLILDRYFFDSNNAVDGCADRKQPGFEHLEWLRIQLQFLRERGVKAIMSGHVPPARNDEKVGWDETCWQKYALWMQQYRDVVVGSVYGHMNIEHFILQDFKDIDVAVAAGEIEPEKRHVKQGANGNDEISAKLKTPDYLMALREIWAKLPTIPDSLSVLEKDDSSESALKKRRKKHKLTDEQKFYSKIGGTFAERFAVSHIAASVVPNFFSTMRVFEYNITGLEDASVSADAFSLPVPAWQECSDDVDVSVSEARSPSWISNAFTKLTSRPLTFLSDLWYTTSAFTTRNSIQDQKHKKHRKKKKPKFTIPNPPSSTSPPGPAYSPQSLSWLGYKQYVANTTYLNDDFHGSDSAFSSSNAKSHSNSNPNPNSNSHNPCNADTSNDIDITGWNPGRNVDRHPSKEKKNGRPTPRNFTYVLEYDTRDESDSYRLREGLTVRKWVELASRIGEFRGEDAMECEGEAELVDDVDDDVLGARRCEYEVGERDCNDCDDDGDGDGDLVVEKHSKHRRKKHKKEKKKKKHEREKKKKRKKRRKIVNRDWFAFVSRAVTATMDDAELHEQFGEVEVNANDSGHDVHVKTCERDESPFDRWLWSVEESEEL